MIQQGCQLLGVSRSGWYPARRRVRQPKVPCGTRVRLHSVFEATGHCYGSRRLRQELAAEGIEIGRHRIRSLMKELQLKPIWKRKFVPTTDSNQNLPVYENVLDRQFEQGSNRVKCGKSLFELVSLLQLAMILYWQYVQHVFHKTCANLDKFPGSG